MGRLYTVTGATTDGEYLSEEMTLDYPDFRLIGIDFFDGAGDKVTPTGGEISVLVDQGSGGYTTVQSGTFDAYAAGEETWPNPTFSGGVARCKIVLAGVTGAESFRASVYRGDIDEALPLRGSYKQTKRLAVDVSQTGFWEGREFRVQLDKTAAYTLKFVSPVDFILQFQNLQTHDGISTFNAYSADQISAEATPFNDVIQILPNNGMSNTPAYSGQVQIFGGGSITLNGTQIPREYIKVKAATATAQQTTVGGNAVKERGLPAGTYYLVFTGTDYSYRLIFEERP